MREEAKFPDEIWDGFSKNTARDSLDHNIIPDGQDWARITAELIATQKFVNSPSVILTLRDLNIFSGITDEIASAGIFAFVKPNDHVRVATSDDGLATGLLTVGGGIGDIIEFRTLGAVVLLDWTSVTGSVLLIPGKHYYLGTNGNMSITPPSTGYVVNVGEAVSDTVFNVQIQPRIKL